MPWHVFFFKQDMYAATDFQRHIVTDVSEHQHFISIGVSNFASGYAGCYWEWCDTTRGAGGLW